jgi:hypothetical protein
VSQFPSIPIPRLEPFGISLPRPGLLASRIAGVLALGTILGGSFGIAVYASAGPSALVPRSVTAFPGWLAGPLNGLIAPLQLTTPALDMRMTFVVAAIGIAYVVALVALRGISTKTIIAVVLALHAIVLLTPPLQLADVFSYIGYARLGALHGLNPYTHVIAQSTHDPVFLFTTWNHLLSPYGPLFTALTYPLALLPLPVAYWVLKLVIVLASLGCLGLVWLCARRLGRDPKTALAFVALNPVYLVFALGGEHNDFFMVIPSLAAIALLLGDGNRDRPAGRREWAAGAALAAAVAIKFTAIVLLPFLLLAVPSARHRLRVLGGAALAAVALCALSLALFGWTLPNVSAQTTLLTAYSIPTMVGDAIGAGGGAPWLLHAADVAVVLVIGWLVLRRRADWIGSAGWATLALLASLAWLVPWYVVWLLPLAALATSTRLRYAAVAMSAFLALTFVPTTPLYLAEHGIRTMTGPIGQASYARQLTLER